MSSPSAPYERAVWTTEGVLLASRSDGVGEGTPLLCCNSLGTEMSTWDAQMPTWAAGRQVIRFDTRGHGASSVSPPPYSIAQLGQDAIAVLDAHDIERADVCGLSLGGVVALWLAINRPERVRRLVLACTSSRIGTREAWEERAATVMSDGGTAAISQMVLDRFFSPRFRSEQPASVATAESSLLRVSAEGYAGCCLALAHADLTDELVTVGASTLVIAGTEDVATPLDVVQRLARDIPDAEWCPIEGSGHLANLESPTRFARAVEDFLRR